MNIKQAEEFSRPWLQAWTGNRPEELIKFYAEDAFYSDPVRREGMRGHKEMLPYFKRLLAANPDWVWELLEAFPMEKGFTGKWKATIPVGGTTITEYGVDIVEVSAGRVTRNEVYFDRAALLEAFRKLK
jgi:ketosteroid isomerase-like protein